MKKIVRMLALCFAFSATLLQADFEDQLSALSDENVEEYVKPLATSLGLSLNSGMYHTADVSSVFGFSFGIKSMTIFAPDDQLTFKPDLPEGYDNSEETATIYGDHAAYYGGPNGYISFPGGLDESVVPIAYPQVAVSFLGTEVMVRYIPEVSIGDADFSLFGGAVKHDISRYIPLCPVDIALQVGFSKVEVSDVMELNNFAVNVHASRWLGLFTVYGGLQYEKTTMDLNYTFEGDSESGDPALQLKKEISVSVDGDNSFGITAGASMKMVFFVLNADYTYNSQSVLSAGMTFEF